MVRVIFGAALAVLIPVGCGGAAPPAPSVPGAFAGAPIAAVRWIPTAGETFQIQYAGTLDLTNPAQIYDVDMFDTSATVVKKLHTMGRRVVCYISAGTWENWRPDAGKFPKSVIGRKDGHWPGERWLDIRQTSILEPIMAHRLDLCKSKGFDAVDPDNLDGYQNKTGFPLTYNEQLTYDTWIATAAHARGLTADQKGDNGQVKDLVKVFDFAVVEQCFAQGWCKQFTLYTDHNRLVVDVEYGLSRNRFLNQTCPSDAGYKETAILKKLSLNAWIVTCSSGS
jgi:hypothetical protein